MLEQLKKIFEVYKKMEPGMFRADANIRLDLGIDSLQFATIAGEIEDAFGVEISDAEAAQIATIGDLMAILSAQI